MTRQTPPEPHQHGLHHDLATIERRMLDRRHLLGFLASAAPVSILAACGGDGGSSSSTGTGSGSSTSSSSSSSSSASSSASSSSSSSSSTASCVVDPTETNGPYPADGTNTASGATSNVLVTSGVVRSDIRSSFISSTTTVAGVMLTLTLRLVRVSSACSPIAGAAIYIWHCSPNGLYSLYSSGATTESWLRGVQITDSNGEVTFTTVYPGCYEGRWPHIHFEVFTGGLVSSTTGRTASLISQIAMPPAINTTVYATSQYSTSVGPYSRVSLSSDNIFADNTAAQLAQQTPALSGSTSAGYTGTLVIGI